MPTRPDALRGVLTTKEVARTVRCTRPERRCIGPQARPSDANRTPRAAKTIREAEDRYDATLLDVDNGPEGLTRVGNDQLYGRAGLAAAKRALRQGGVLAVWSARPDKAFSERLARVGFEVDESTIRARGASGGARHTIWIATRLG